ncbi:winged helix-turn-helix transcriptional regulator [Nocardioides panacisoli]|uniref:Redoxin domain-containing protein n=1 Tax=Nocardioides panacisoli TaxID=627624 RepID=A0ABP7IDG7_9ACTN
MRYDDLADADCGIAQTLGVVGDWWSWLIVRDVAGGTTRFDGLQRALGISRRALAERLVSLVDHGVLRRSPYSDRPVRYDYLLTDRGEGLLPVLVAMQEYGDRFLLGDGSVTATAGAGSREADRVRALTGSTVPPLTLSAHDGSSVPVAGDGWRVLYFFPGAFAPDVHGYPPRWDEIPGAAGCTLESTTYAARHAAFADLGCGVYGVSTQRPDQQAAFADLAALPFLLLSDEDARLGASLRLPMFRAAGVDRFKRQSLLVDPTGTVRHVQMPITDPAGSVDEMLEVLGSLAR